MGRAACACRVREGGHAGAAGDGERAEAGGVGAEGVHLRTEDAEVELAGALTSACTRQGGRGTPLAIFLLPPATSSTPLAADQLMAWVVRSRAGESGEGEARGEHRHTAGVPRDGRVRERGWGGRVAVRRPELHQGVPAGAADDRVQPVRRSIPLNCSGLSALKSVHRSLQPRPLRYLGAHLASHLISEASWLAQVLAGGDRRGAAQPAEGIRGAEGQGGQGDEV